MADQDKSKPCSHRPVWEEPTIRTLTVCHVCLGVRRVRLRRGGPWWTRCSATFARWLTRSSSRPSCRGFGTDPG
jgi:hypothetical protein